MKLFERRDEILWERDLAEHPRILEALRKATARRPATILVNGVPVQFVPAGGDAPGYRAEGVGKVYWNTEVPVGTVVELHLPGDELLDLPDRS